MKAREIRDVKRASVQARARLARDILRPVTKDESARRAIESGIRRDEFESVETMTPAEFRTYEALKRAGF